MFWLVVFGGFVVLQFWCELWVGLVRALGICCFELVCFDCDGFFSGFDDSVVFVYS